MFKATPRLQVLGTLMPMIIFLPVHAASHLELSLSSPARLSFISLSLASSFCFAQPWASWFIWFPSLKEDLAISGQYRGLCFSVGASTLEQVRQRIIVFVLYSLLSQVERFILSALLDDALQYISLSKQNLQRQLSNQPPLRSAAANGRPTFPLVT